MTEPTGAVVTVGETMLLLSGTEPGEVAELEHLRVDTGGAESNVAIGLVRAGVPATWVGRVGADPAGDRVLRDVRSAGVDVVPVVDPDRSTGLMVKERLHDGRTRVTYHRRHSAASALVPEDVPAGLVERAAAVHLTGITLALSDTARATVQAVLDRADAAGVPVSFDVNHRAKLIDAATARGSTVRSPSAPTSCSPVTTRPACSWASATTRAPTRTSPTRSPPCRGAPRS